MLPVKILRLVIIIFTFVTINQAYSPHASTQQQNELSTEHTDVKPLVEKFYRILHSELATNSDGSDTRFYLRSLKESDQLAVARVIVNESQPTVSYFAIPILVESGYEEEAVPAVVNMITKNYDLAPLYYYLVHLDNEIKSIRLIFYVNTFLLNNLEKYKEKTKTRVEQFLVEPPTPFSISEAKKRIDKLKSKINNLVKDKN